MVTRISTMLETYGSLRAAIPVSSCRDRCGALDSQAGGSTLRRERLLPGVTPPLDRAPKPDIAAADGWTQMRHHRMRMGSSRTTERPPPGTRVRPPPVMPDGRWAGQGELHGCARAGSARGPYLSPVRFDDRTADRESHAMPPGLVV